MSRQLTDGFHDAKNELVVEEPFVWLYEIDVPAATPGGSPRALRLTNYSEALEYGTDSLGDPLTFSPFPISHGVIRSSQSGDIVAIQVTVGNATREIGELIDAFGGLVGEAVKVRLINIESIADPQAILVWRTRIADASLTTEGIGFELRPARLERAKVPGLRYSAIRCRHEFGQPRCGYVILASPGETVGTGFSTCARTFSACEERGLDEAARSLQNRHPTPRFGGFPGIPRR